MSETKEIDMRYWEQYLLDLRALSEDGKYILNPSLKDYAVWLQEQDLDESDVDYE